MDVRRSALGPRTAPTTSYRDIPQTGPARARPPARRPAAVRAAPRDGTVNLLFFGPHPAPYKGSPRRPAPRLQAPCPGTRQGRVLAHRGGERPGKAAPSPAPASSPASPHAAPHHLRQRVRARTRVAAAAFAHADVGRSLALPGAPRAAASCTVAMSLGLARRSSTSRRRPCPRPPGGYGRSGCSSPPPDPAATERGPDESAAALTGHEIPRPPGSWHDTVAAVRAGRPPSTSPGQNPPLNITAEGTRPACR